MVIFRYLIHETFKAQLAVLVVLLTIFLSQQFVQVLGEASAGQLPGQLVLQVMALQLPGLASLILPISLFLGILMAHGRLYADHEMTVLHACGVSEWYVTRVTLVFALALALVTASLTLWLGPWALAQEHEISERARAEAGISIIQPGRFQQAASQNAVIFVEEQLGDGSLREIFVAQMPGAGSAEQQASVVKASRGRVESTSGGGQQLMLEEGRRYSQNLATFEHQVMSFRDYQMQIQEPEADTDGQRLEAVPTQNLWQDPSPASQAELQWRLAIPMSMPLLTLIAVPLSRINPRQGKFARMAPAILIYMGYFLVLMATKRALEDGSLPLGLGLWWIQAGLLLLGLSLLLKERPMGVRLWARLRRRR